MRRSLLVALALLSLALPAVGEASAPEDGEPAATATAGPTGVAPAPSAPAEDGSPTAVPDPLGAVPTPVMPTFDAPTWGRVVASRGPAAREDHTWTVDATGASAYLFGGRDGDDAFDDLWRYDLATDTWDRLRPAGPAPDARFGHNAVWVDDVGLVIFAGQAGTDFHGDLWVYDPGSNAWEELPDGGAPPRPRYGSCAIVGPDGRFWISHGFTFAGRFDDTRAYSFERQRWTSIAPDGRRPGQRCLHDCFRSSAGELVLYGGQDDQDRALGDLWVTRADGSWDRRPDPGAPDRRLPAVTETDRFAFVFGGAGQDDDPLGDLWRVDRETLEFEQVPTQDPGPSERHAAALITDRARGRLLLFGGKGRHAMADVWQLTDTADPDDQVATADG